MTCCKFLKSCVPPQYAILSIMGFLGIVVSLAVRGCLSIAITEMVVPIQNVNKGNELSICPADKPSSNYSINSVHIGSENFKRYNWTEKQQSWILSSFYVGYLVSHIPGGLLAEKFGGKMVFSLSVLLTAICNAATPHALIYGGYHALILSRIGMGLVSGVTFPALMTLLAAWIPSGRRGIYGSLPLSGTLVGNLVSFYISGIILSYQPWPVTFYFWSVIAIIWVIIFMVLCYKDPASHPFITKKELNYLKVEMGQLERHTDLPSTPWKSILTSVPVIALIINQMGNDCIWIILAADMPKYMRQVLGFSVERAGLFSSIPYVFVWMMTILSGFLCDYLIDRRYLTIGQARKLFTVLTGGTSILLVAASYAGCNRTLAVILISLAMVLFGNYCPGIRVNGLDLSPNYSGSIMSISNGCGSIASLVFQNFIGMIIPDSTLEQWRSVFWTLVGISIIRVTIFTIWASGDVQPWNNPKEFNSPECEKLADCEGNINANSTENKPEQINN